MTVLAQNMTLSEDNDNSFSQNGNINISNIQIPIVGYEIMEERARFTAYDVREANFNSRCISLRIENKLSGDCWYVFRRYTDFVRLCSRLRNNFPRIFLEERVSGLQTLVNAILNVPELIASQEIQDFFCLNEPPVCTETNEESRAMFEALEETINDLLTTIARKRNND
ncbi:hypothetical protein NQ317_014750 [Molorchus minor]|uniref:PX domain-containing protein n=1 Tax=Molorchus minor TaxID=1323400 RepID=A0ABQ9J1V9_9CUCU|nr:hypothetical protein NQ317_014750 [Molorchus minor]